MPITDARVDLAAKMIVQQKVHETVLAGLPERVRTPELSVRLRQVLAALPIRDCLELSTPYDAELEAEIEDNGSVTVLLGQGESQVVQSLVEGLPNASGNDDSVLR